MKEKYFTLIENPKMLTNTVASSIDYMITSDIANDTVEDNNNQLSFKNNVSAEEKEEILSEIKQEIQKGNSGSNYPQIKKLIDKPEEAGFERIQGANNPITIGEIRSYTLDRLTGIFATDDNPDPFSKDAIMNSYDNNSTPAQIPSAVTDANRRAGNNAITQAANRPGAPEPRAQVQESVADDLVALLPLASAIVAGVATYNSVSSPDVRLGLAVTAATTAYMTVDALVEPSGTPQNHVAPPEDTPNNNIHNAQQPQPRR